METFKTTKYLQQQKQEEENNNKNMLPINNTKN